MRFPRARDVLYRIKWGDQALELARLIVKDRSDGVKEIHGADIIAIARRSFDTDSVTIPFYKVMVIYYKGEEIWRRP